MLSTLDTISRDLFECLQESPRLGTFIKTREGGLRRHFNGHALEAWVLKTTIGLIKSKHVDFPGHTDEWLPPPHLLNALFFGDRLQAPLGFCIVEGANQSRLGCHAYADSEARLVFFEVRFTGLTFGVIVNPPLAPAPFKYVHRPSQILFQGMSREVHLLWDE
jgi:hypothetical protein